MREILSKLIVPLRLRRLFTFIFALVVGAGIMFADSGKCGDNLTWTLNDGVLTISGTGAMWDYDSEDPTWTPYIASIKSVVIENGVTSIGDYAFDGCEAMTAVDIPNSITIVDVAAFARCKALTSITIPDNVASIGSWAFQDCLALTTVVIGSGVTELGNSTFAECSAITSITCRATTPPTCGDDCFQSVMKSIPVYVPKGTEPSYRKAAGWEAFTNIQETTGIESIQQSAVSSQKVLRNGQLFILRDGKTYTVTGQEVK